MGRNSGNTCYLSQDQVLVPRRKGSGCYHHPHTLNEDCCVDPTSSACLFPSEEVEANAPVECISEENFNGTETARDSNILVIGDNSPYNSVAGTHFQVVAKDLEQLVGNRGSGLAVTGTFPQENGVKSNEGAVFRARNLRTDQLGGAMIWYLIDDPGVAVGCWNPPLFAKVEDWAIGDKIEFIDFEPNGTTRDPILPINSYKALTGTGWNLPASAIQFGQSGCVGAWWEELEIQYDLTFLSNVTGIWTDSSPLSYTVSYFDGNKWLKVDGKFSGSTEVPSVQTQSVRLRWNTTDLFQLLGLSSYRAGGGIHAEPTGFPLCES